MKVKNYNIAIDGPAGAGKSTVARKVAEQLDMMYVDTGAMYRAITLEVLNNGITNVEEIVKIAENLVIEMKDGEIRLNGKDVTDEIRSREVTQKVSEVSEIPGVRYHMTVLQREIARDKGAILDGRDIGTTVLPDADYKFFLTASIEERATRRFKELLGKGAKVDFCQVKKDISGRDDKDSHRSCSPLSTAKDAIIIDTTDMTIDEVVLKIIRYIK